MKTIFSLLLLTTMLVEAADMKPTMRLKHVTPVKTKDEAGVLLGEGTVYKTDTKLYMTSLDGQQTIVGLRDDLATPIVTAKWTESKDMFTYTYKIHNTSPVRIRSVKLAVDGLLEGVLPFSDGIDSGKEATYVVQSTHPPGLHPMFVHSLSIAEMMSDSGEGNTPITDHAFWAFVQRQELPHNNAGQLWVVGPSMRELTSVADIVEEIKAVTGMHRKLPKLPSIQLAALPDIKTREELLTWLQQPAVGELERQFLEGMKYSLQAIK